MKCVAVLIFFTCLLLVPKAEGLSALKRQQQQQIHLIFPGGGVFFNWQGGVISYLRENNYDLSKCTFSGSSAGSLTACLAVTGVDFDYAAEKALSLAARYQVWDRQVGLKGVLGPMIEEWLDALLPEDLDPTKMAKNRLSVIVTPVPLLWKKEKLTDFSSRQELMDALLASIYLPFFSDGGICKWVCNRPYIDGNFLSTGKHYRPEGSKRSSTIFLNWQKDPVLKSNFKGEEDLVATLTPEAVWGLVRQGRSYAAMMESKGRFKNIPKLES